MIDCCRLLLVQHQETRRLLQSLEEYLTQYSSDSSGLAAAEAVYAALLLDLKQHFMLEEQGLFETVNQYRTMILMEVEHDDLLNLQANLGQALKSCQDSPQHSKDALLCFHALKDRLLVHMKEEEDGIFPLVNQWLEPEEKQKVLRRFSEIQGQLQVHEPQLIRAKPKLEVSGSKLFQPIMQPIAYELLYEHEHTTIQHLSLKANQALAFHWAGQNQCIVLVSGNITCETQEQVQELTPGMTCIIESRLLCSIKAITDSHLIVFKIWPHPHYTKAPSGA